MTKYLTICVLLLLPFATSAEDKAEDNKTLVTVNGVAITQQEVINFLGKKEQPVPPQNALQEMINVELLVQDAKNAGIMQNQQLQMEIKRSNSSLIASYHLQNILKEVNLDDKQLQDRYRKEYVEGDRNSEYNANHILVKTEEEAQAIIKQLGDGAEFTELAKSASIGPSGKDGGALGWFKSADMVAAFSTAAQALEPGQTTRQPVQTQFGWHVILLNDVRTAEPPSFNAVRQQLATTIAAEYINQHVKSLQDKADIQFPGQ